MIVARGASAASHVPARSGELMRASEGERVGLTAGFVCEFLITLH